MGQKLFRIIIKLGIIAVLLATSIFVGQKIKQLTTKNPPASEDQTIVEPTESTEKPMSQEDSKNIQELQTLDTVREQEGASEPTEEQVKQQTQELDALRDSLIREQQ